MLSLQTFGKFELFRDGERVPIKLLWTRKLIGLLSFRPGKVWSRDGLCGQLWPDVELEVARNRLRTTLVEVRGILGTDCPISGDRQELHADLSRLELAISEAKLRTRRIQLAEDAPAEIAALSRLLEIVTEDIFSDWEDEWLMAERAHWQMKRQEAWLRRGTLRFEHGEFSGAREDADLALVQDVYDERAWRLLLRVAEAQGESESVISRFRTAHQELRDQGLSFSDELRALARQVRDGQAPSTYRLSEESLDFLRRVFERMMRDDPTQALQWTAQPAVRQETMVTPLASEILLREVLDRTDGHSEARLQTTVSFLQSGYMRHDTTNIIEFAPWVLANDPDLYRRRNAALMLSFVHFQIREFDEAYRYGRLAVELSQEEGNPFLVAAAESQIASFDWHQGLYEQAIEKYLVRVEVLDANPEVLAQVNATIIMANLGIVHTILEEYELADAWWNRAVATHQTSSHYGGLANLGDPCRGFVRCFRGDQARGSELLVAGLGRCLRQKDRRALEIGMDYLAGALGLRGRGPEGMAIAERATELRKARRHYRSIAEERQLATVHRLCGYAEPNPDWVAIDRLSELLALGTDGIT